jgi:hypothetical protein
MSAVVCGTDIAIKIEMPLDPPSKIFQYSQLYLLINRHHQCAQGFHGMAAIDTFDWLVKQVWPKPDAEAKRFIDDQRDYILTIRNEDERIRFIEELMHYAREAKKKKAS